MSGVLLSSSSNPGLAHLTVKTFLNCGKADCTGSGQSKSRRKNKNFGPDQNALLSERFQGQKLTFWPAFFNFNGSKCTRKAKNPIFVAIIF
jgi:hypothetical protein